MQNILQFAFFTFYLHKLAKYWSNNYFSTEYWTIQIQRGFVVLLLPWIRPTPPLDPSHSPLGSVLLFPWIFPTPSLDSSQSSPPLDPPHSSLESVPLLPWFHLNLLFPWIRPILNLALKPQQNFLLIHVF